MNIDFKKFKKLLNEKENENMCNAHGLESYPKLWYNDIIEILKDSEVK